MKENEKIKNEINDIYDDNSIQKNFQPKHSKNWL